MKPNQKALLVALIVMTAACVGCGTLFMIISDYGMSLFVPDNSESGAKIAQSLINYIPPAGYREHGGVDLGLIKYTYITPDGRFPDYADHNTIILTSVPEIFDLEADQFRLELEFALLAASEEVSTMELIREEPQVIAGSEVVLKYFETFGQYDPPVTMVFSSPFPGKAEEVMVVLAGPSATLDAEFIAKFLTSLHLYP